MGFFGALVFGIIFSLGWTPCVGAFLGSALMLASQQGHVLQGMGMLLAYSLGLGVPFLLSAVLIDYLRSAGADITVEKNAIIIHGRELSGGEVTVEGDPIEAGTYAALSAITGGNITVLGVSYASLEAFFAPLLEAGAHLDTDGGITLRTLPKEQTSIVAEPYPGFPTDLQPIAAPILACANGGTLEDRVWQGRLGYLAALAPFGVRYRAYPTGAEIFPSELHAADTIAPDLRGGASALLIALAARGESRIRSSEIIARGYESIEKKLRTLGAQISVDD
jgi:UDP-N-acetylglucosamine enolpyruvyl transferase